MRDTVLTGDLGPCVKGAYGLRVNSGVTLDGQEHLITGGGGQIEQYGVELEPGTSGVTIQNVRVTKFQRGIRLRAADHNTVTHCEAFQNGNMTTHVGYGIDMAKGSAFNTLADNTIHDNADEGLHMGSSTAENVVRGNAIYNNYRENLYLLASREGRYEHNHLWGSGAASIYIKKSHQNVFVDNTVEDKPVHLAFGSSGNHFVNNTLQRSRYTFTNADPQQNPVEESAVTEIHPGQ